MTEPKLLSGSGNSYQSNAAGLLNQQLGSFGRDVKFTAGNMVVESGFRRMVPPQNRKDCAIADTFEMGDGRRIVLRGSGVFVGDESFGGLFVIGSSQSTFVSRLHDRT